MNEGCNYLEGKSVSPKSRYATAYGFVIKDAVHVFRDWGRNPGRRGHGLTVDGWSRHLYCCQDECHDWGLRPDVEEVVEKARALGAQKVILITGRGSNRVHEIAGLPVVDIDSYSEELVEGIVFDHR